MEELETARWVCLNLESVNLDDTLAYFRKISGESIGGENIMLEYQDGTYLCNGTKQVEVPLNLEILAEAVRRCLKLQQVSLDDAPFGDQCFPVLA